MSTKQLRRRGGRPLIAGMGWLLVLSATLLGGCNFQATATVPTFVPPTPRTEAPSPLERPTAAVTLGELAAVVEVPGEIVAEEEQELYFTTGGMVRAVHRDEGDTVAPGDLIAELDADALEREILQRTTNLTVARLELAQLEERAATMAPEILATNPLTYDLAIAREQTKLAEALYQHARGQLNEAQLTAPVGGTITSLVRDRGSRVEAYEIVGRVADLSARHGVAWLPVEAAEAATDAVTPGAEVTVLLPQRPGEVYTATVREVAAEAELRDGLWVHAVTLALSDAALAALPPAVPLEITARFTGETRADVVQVPTMALSTFPGQAYLDVLQDDGTVQRVPVETGATDGEQTEILSGVEAGQVVALP